MKLKDKKLLNLKMSAKENHIKMGICSEILDYMKKYVKYIQ